MTDVAVAEVDVKAVVCLVIVCFKATSAKLLLSMRFVPVKVIDLVSEPLTEGEEAEMLVKAGDEALSRYVKSQLLTHLLRISNLVEATT